MKLGNGMRNPGKLQPSRVKSSFRVVQPADISSLTQKFFLVCLDRCTSGMPQSTHLIQIYQLIQFNLQVPLGCKATSTSVNSNLRLIVLPNFRDPARAKIIKIDCITELMLPATFEEKVFVLCV